ncbi:hypothetical protein ACGFZB_41305 [Streptomyces cinerochromogenes]|uniref:Uncharacterized protein n=1 Tax=Streptomyces cinerochromogenes TaxID=66422 RepID=A0ABW7BHZ4_9ACTN
MGTGVVDEATALAQAQASGEQVEVTGDRTEYSTTQANPDGSFTLTQSTTPQRVKEKDGGVMANILDAAGSYRTAEHFAESVVIPLAGFIQPEQLEGILTAWAENQECRAAAKMPEFAALFWTKAPQLHGLPAWAEFVKRVQGLAETDWYLYDELAACIRSSEAAAS